MLVEYNDWQLNVYEAHGISFSEIAAALFENNELVFGYRAWQSARRRPQNFNNRYLANLSAEPLSGDLGPAKNHADLIYHHLRSLAADVNTTDPVALGVPGYLTNEQLGLLMGICQEAGLAVAGFVDIALAHALADLSRSETLELLHGRNFHVLDIEQHRLSLTQIVHDDQTLSCLPTRTFDGLGLLSIIDGWMNVIADEFVHKTRFDPTHSGECEQQMLNQVYAWCTHNEIQPRVQIEHGGTERQIEVSHKDLHNKLRQRLSALELNSGDIVALTNRSQHIPGLADLISQQDVSVMRLDTSGATTSYARLTSRLTPGQVSRIQSCAVSATATPPAQTPSPASIPCTHLLNGAHAYPLTDAKFADTNLNDLQAGDEIKIGGQIYMAIVVD